MVKYDIILYGEEEFKCINNKKYNILKVDNYKKEKYMIKIFNKFITNQNNNLNEKHYIGIDLEYNKVSKSKRDISLLQLNLENDSNKSYIFVLYPPDLKSDNLNILINLLTNEYIIKILHGGESLDIPYLFDQLFISKNNIDNFCKNFYDTKYLCDYNFMNNFKLIQIESEMNKSFPMSCSIYKLLLQAGIINIDKYNDLDKIEDTIGPIYLINIDIYNLDYNVLRYALYDVIFLPELIKYFMNMDYNKSLIISEISQLVYKYKRNIDKQFLDLEKIINTMNTFTLKFENKKFKLNDIWNIYFSNLIDDFILLNSINYFKAFIKIITKFIIYSNIYDKYTLYTNKNIIFKYDFKSYYKWLIFYPNINNILINYNNLIKDEINNWI
jgi:hypothetical protein